MSQNTTLVIMSLLSILFASFHISDDIVRGMEPGGFSNLGGVLILVVWTYATLVLAGRRLGLALILLAALGAAALPAIHMRGAGLVGGRLANTAGIYFFVWTLMAVGVTATITVMLAARALWASRRPGRRDIAAS